MKISKHFNNFLILALVFWLLITSRAISKNHEKPLVFVSKQQSSLNFNNSFLNFINMGQKRLISSILWVSTIIESDHDHYKNRDLNSWMFLRFKTISYLEPKFYEVYNFGGPYLSIIKDDLEGASVIYQRGLQYFPDDYSLLYNAAFHFYFEEKDYKLAHPALVKLAKFSKAPLFALSALARLDSNEGNIKEAYLNLTQYQERHPLNSPIGRKIYEYRYSLKAQMDLECLNNKFTRGEDCDNRDLDGTKYIYRNGKYESVRNWVPFKLKREGP